MHNWCMANIPSRVLREAARSRQFWGELDAERLVDWLNEKQRTPAHRRIERLLGAIQAVLVEFPSPAKPTLKFNALQKELAHYRFHPRLAAWSRTSKHGKAHHRAQFGWHSMNPVGWAVLAIMELGREDLLWRVKRCVKLGCGRWFYARFTHQNFHSTECQQAHYKSSPEWREHRRQYARRYRREHGY